MNSEVGQLTSPLSLCTGWKCHPVKFGSPNTSWTISCLRAYDVPAPNTTCGKMLIEEIAKSWSWCCLMPLCNMMGNDPFGNGIMNAQLKWWAPMRYPPSTKSSPMVARSIPEAATVGIENWFKREHCPCPPPCRRTSACIFQTQKMFEARGLLFVATQQTILWQKGNTKVGIGIDVYITNSSPLPIPDWQSKILPGWV